MKNIKAVVFDAGYTLLKPSKDEWFIPDSIFDIVDEKSFRALDKESYKRAYGAGYDFLDVIHDDVKTEEKEYEQFLGFYKAFSKEVPQLGWDDEICKKLSFDHTYNDKKFVFYEDTKTCLEKLKGKYLLGVLSDTWPSLDRIFRNYGIRDYFDAFVLSCDVGVFKPDEKIYHALIDAIGVEAESIVFVDDVLKNLDGAKALGINPVQILREDFPKGNYPTVSNLDELIKLLENI